MFVRVRIKEERQAVGQKVNAYRSVRRGGNERARVPSNNEDSGWNTIQPLQLNSNCP